MLQQFKIVSAKQGLKKGQMYITMLWYSRETNEIPYVYGDV